MQQELCNHTHTGIQGQQPLALRSKATTRKRGQYRGQRLYRGKQAGNASEQGWACQRGRQIEEYRRDKVGRAV